MNLLEEARLEINEIDREMARLFTRRMHAVEKVAAYKKEQGMAIFDPVREQQVIARNAGALEEDALRPYYVDFLKNAMRVSRAYQKKMLESGALCARTLRMELGEDSYDILMERGILKRAGELLQLDRRVLIVTDDGVPRQYALTVAAQCKEPVIVTLPQGEGTKNAESLQRLWKTMLQHSFTRSDCVVAVGGGVMGDLAGFCAATYMRGVDFYNIPTTLLSQVDSSIGGKVAVDFCEVKNIVGAFHQPKRVLIDPDVLKTLPPRQIANGLAEALKESLTSDAELFAIIEQGVTEETLETVIEKALQIKKAVVEEDEKESGLRRILNFGHTLGHGIESESGLDGLYHGECVALGMIPMCSASVRERLIPVLAALGLPTVVEGDLETILNIAAHDKKRSGSDISVVWVESIGSCEIRRMPLEEWKQMIRTNLGKGDA
ncbi:MAG: 3-dehydroquinate synthase [Clostridia bacterium]|nr:3-dehydroquinate synthase [Clostridia bacterium]